MNKISTIIIASVLAFSLQPANAGLLGMPLNLKATMEQAEPGESGSPAIFRYRSFQFFYGNDVLTSSLSVSRC